MCVALAGQGTLGSAALQGLLGLLPSWPLFATVQAHHPPVIQTSAFPLHEFKRGGIPFTDIKFDLCAKQHS
jgi:hypothetical protein